MEYNPLAHEYNSFKHTITTLDKKKDALLDEITRHENTDIDSLNKQLAELTPELEKKTDEIKRIASAIRGSNTLIKLGNHSYAKYLKRDEQIKTQLVLNVESFIREKEAVENDITRHLSFDSERIKREIKQIDEQIISIQSAHEKLAEKKESIDLELKPIVERMSRLKNQIQHERSMKKADFLQRDFDKMEQRAVIVGRKAARLIQAFIIDGNNMCYEGSRFIGLEALQNTVQEIEREYDVTVVFDADIRSLTKNDDAGIKSLFSEFVKTHVVASGQKADETILNLASNNLETYIISNDRFVDYPGKEVIRQDRLIRHEIINNRVFVHDLNIDVTYA